MSAPQSTIASHDSIDDILGDGRHRFFSQGYKTTNPRLHELQVIHTGPTSTLTARASLGVEGIWSVKGSSEQTPHLGTTDVIVLACRMAEVLLASKYSSELLPEAHLISVTVSGGSAPVEGNLNQLECRALLEESTIGSSSTLQCSISSMSATLEVAHPDGAAVADSVELPCEEALVGDASSRLYGDLWSERQVALENVRIKNDDESAHARLSLDAHSSRNGVVERHGLEANYIHELCAVEYFVSALQLGQVLLYRLDAMDRAESNTLWMRRTRITLRASTSHQWEGAQEAGLSVVLSNKRLITKDGDVWRCADVVGTFNRGEVVCSVAHRLPVRLTSSPREVEQ